MKMFLTNFVRALTILMFAFTSSNLYAKDKVSVLMKTSMGDITIELFPKKAPLTVENFLTYVNEDFYNGTIFHRVIDGFMIQGGGHDTDMNKKATKAPIVNEAQAFVPNARGTIAMARTNDPNSATAQFFINVVNNSFLNKSNASAGYAVFGKVTQGMGVVDKIAKARTAPQGMFRDAPLEQIVILSVEKL